LISGAAVFFAWRQSLATFTHPMLYRPDLSRSWIEGALHECAQSAVLVGVLVSPAVVLAGPKRLLRNAWARAPWTSAVVGLVTLVELGGEVLRDRDGSTVLGPGYYVQPQGVGNIGNDVLPRHLLVGLALVGVVALLFAVFAFLPPTLNALTRIRRAHLGTPTSPALSIVALAAAGYVLTCMWSVMTRGVLFDRYFLPVLPLVGILVLEDAGGTRASATPRVRAFGSAALLALAAFGGIYAANAASFNGTAWRVAEQAAELAGNPKRVSDPPSGGGPLTTTVAFPSTELGRHQAAGSASWWEAKPIPKRGEN
jgi:hypothetical protein